MTKVKSTYDLSIRQLKSAYIKAQKKVWKYANKMDKCSYSRTYDPYKVFKSHEDNYEWWRRRGVNLGYELQRREVWLIDPGRHNQTNI